MALCSSSPVPNPALDSGYHPKQGSKPLSDTLWEARKIAARIRQGALGIF